MENETIIKEYENKKIRYITVNNVVYYSIVDVISILTESERSRKYWNDLKSELAKNGSQLSGKIGQLKMQSIDGKSYLTDVIDSKNLINLINYIPSKKKEKFIEWLKNENEIEKVENTEIVPYNGQKITNLIYEIRGVQVMLDSDLAVLYNCKNGTKTINLAVKRNIERFPEKFMFQLTLDEIKCNSRFQIETLNRLGHNIKYLPYAFTEEGVAMLSAVLRTDVAAKISVAIMEAFVLMRKYLSRELLEQRNIYNQVFKNTEDIKLLQESFNSFREEKKNSEIYFQGQIYDAYSKIVDIFKMAKEELIIIDGYADKIVLDIIRNIKVPVTLIVKKNRCLKEIDIKKYQEQYHNLKIKYNEDYHDRYFIIDKKIIYHCGTSINHIGSKTFSINLLTDDDIKNALLEKIKNIK